MYQNGQIIEVLNTYDYISSYSEQMIDDYLETLVDDIAAQYTQINVEDKDNKGVVVQELVKYDKALYILHILQKYEEQN